MILTLKDGKHLYQWDRERVLVVLDETIDEVHFTNDAVTRAIKKEVYDLDGQRLVDIPAVLLQCACVLTAYAYKCEGGEREYTYIHEQFKVIARKQPDDYIPPEEHDQWENLKAEVLQAMEEAKSAASSAATSEQNAAASEEVILEAKEELDVMLPVLQQAASETEKNVADAKNYAADAEASAAAAQNAQTAAETDRAATEIARQAAADSAESANSSATSAANSAAAAKESEINAANSAAAAGNSEREAKKSETNANESALTATTKAEEASNSATASQAAKTAAEAAQAAAEKARDEAADVAGGDFASNSALNAHTGNGTVHITDEERAAWNSKAEGKHTHDQYLTEHQDISGKADATDLNAHTGNGTVHITAEERTAWNNKSNFSGSYNDLTNKPTEATTSAAGFMSAADKANLDRLVSSAVSVLSGAAEPTSDVGNDGDIYLVTGE